MARGFRNFSDFAFIQEVDKRRFLEPLLRPFKAYFRRQGINIRALKNTDEDDRRLLGVFTQPDEEMPGRLLEALFVLDDLADEAGHDRLMDEARRQGVSLSSLIGKNLSPGEFAIGVYLSFPDVVREAQERTLSRKMKTYEEYQASGDKRVTLEIARSKREALEKPMARWFEKNDRSRACEIYVYEEDDEIHFEITHGRLFKTDSSIDKALRRSRVGYRPQKHDSVVYDRRRGTLKINAQTEKEKRLYRTVTGDVLFGDEDYFPAGRFYTLKPLRRSEPSLKLVDGLRGARLTEVWIEHDAVGEFVQISRARDLLEMARIAGNPRLAAGSLVRASFFLRYESGGRSRKVEVRPPNVAIYDRAREASITEAFLAKNGFLQRPKE